MKKLVITFFVFGLCSWYAPFSASSQISLKDLFSSSSIEEAVGSILGGQSLTAEALNGTWKYSKPACEFKSDDLLKKAGGALAASQIEDKLAEIYTKVGITEEMKYTFNAADSTLKPMPPKDWEEVSRLMPKKRRLHFRSRHLN